MGKGISDRLTMVPSQLQLAQPLPPFIILACTRLLHRLVNRSLDASEAEDTLLLLGWRRLSGLPQHGRGCMPGLLELQLQDTLAEVSDVHSGVCQGCLQGIHVSVGSCQLPKCIVPVV